METQYLYTAGVDFLTKDVHLERGVVTMRMWESTGIDRGSECCVLVCDVTNRESAGRMMERWEEFVKVTEGHVPCIVAGNKTDREGERRGVRCRPGPDNKGIYLYWRPLPIGN